MPNLTQADVDYLVKARKFIYRTVEDTTKSNPQPDELRITYDIRKKAKPREHIRLQFHARRDSAGSRWGISLKWQGIRIRGIDYKIREDIIKGGLIQGRIKHWHEHVWTEADGDKNIIDANGFVKNEDMRAIIEMCMARWNIEGYGQQYRLEGM